MKKVTVWLLCLLTVGCSVDRDHYPSNGASDLVSAPRALDSPEATSRLLNAQAIGPPSPLEPPPPPAPGFWHRLTKDPERLKTWISWSLVAIGVSLVAGAMAHGDGPTPKVNCAVTDCKSATPPVTCTDGTFPWYGNDPNGLGFGNTWYCAKPATGYAFHFGARW